MPKIIKTIDNLVKDLEVEIWIFVKKIEAFNASVFAIESYLHKRSEPIELYATEKISFSEKMKMERTDYPVKQGRCFGISNFLSKNECNELITLCLQLKFKSIKWEYSPSYRSCKRLCKFIFFFLFLFFLWLIYFLVGHDDKFASIVWNRLKEILVRDDLYNIKPYGFGNEGIWSPDHVNPCIRFSEYSAGDHFQMHRDGGFVIHDDLRSVYTLMIYLNDDFIDGETEIFENPQEVIIIMISYHFLFLIFFF